MAEVVHNDGEMQPLAEDEEVLLFLPVFLYDTSAQGIIQWIRDNADRTTMIPTAWHLFQTRIQEHPNEATEVDQRGNLLIHRVFSTSAPLSLVQLLIETHPEGLYTQDIDGQLPLHHAVYHPYIDCFRAVLYNGIVEATTKQDVWGYNPLNSSTMSGFGLAIVWELLCYNPKSVAIQNGHGETALERYRKGKPKRPARKSLLVRMQR